MPVCVHCARPVPSLLAKFGSGHVVPVRCLCGRLADPYLEYGRAIVLIDLLLAKPRAYRHILYNAPTHGSSHSVLLRSTKNGWIQHVRRFVALVLVESYLRWFSICVHPYVTTGALAEPRADPESWLAILDPFVPLYLQGLLRVLSAVFIEMLVLHMVAVAAGTAVQWLWQYRYGRTYWRLYSIYAPSTGLLFASLSKLLLLALRLVWDSKLPADRRLQQAVGLDLTQWLPSETVPKLLRPFLRILSGLVREWNTNWLIHNVIGGVNAGMALAGAYLLRG